MTALRISHTAQLAHSELRALRNLLDEAFAGEFTDDDYEHVIGGVHALVWDGDELVGHGSVVMRRLLHRERALRTGYVEGVAVRPGRRRCGHATAVMAALEDVIAKAYELGALSATDDSAALYAARGWHLWAGPTSVITPGGVQRTEEDDGAVYVRPVTAELDLDGDLACDWRGGDVW